ncbi:MAG: DUF3604 domain-containing protein [Novosphingobium sp.]|nr:DUF3604 domain-containing protein [Novosphingobium sp.]
MSRKKRAAMLIGLGLSAVAGAWLAAPALGGSVEAAASPSETMPTAARPQPYSPPLRAPAENNLYWGDTHLHTANSTVDAFVQGTRLVGPAEAYRFAMGEEITADNGVRAKLRRPLDFLAVTDHSENIGLFPRIAAGDPMIAGTPLAERYGEVLDLVGKVGLRNAFMTVMRKHGSLPDVPEEFSRSVWDEITRTADQYNRPGHFTALIGYEWTSMINGDNLHRVVLYRDGGARASKMLPLDAMKDSDPETLWAGLARYEEGGGKVLAIAHNGNLSNGRMFAPKRVNGQPLDRKYAEIRARWEPVYEVTQVKGDGETHPSLSPKDEFADFETWDRANVANTALNEPWMLRYEYARQALRDGLGFERSLGVNPFKFGMIGSTDIHTGLSTTAEDNFFGKFRGSSPEPGRFMRKMAGEFEEGQSEMNWELGASGLAAVWAPENTREAIFDAFRRREVYATSGSRIRLRFFGGWNFERDDIERADYARYGYSHGVPMGGDMPRREGAKSPSFLVHAARDPDSANLDRVQVVKGWLDSAGKSHERVYNVALADGRPIGPDGAIKPIGSSVDVSAASYRNSIGDPELATWWSDPDFDAAQPSFYYVRVLEIPTPRWTTHDSVWFRAPLPSDVPRTVQDRAYSSPIWYRP